LMATVLIFGVVIYFQGFRVDLPIKCSLQRPVLILPNQTLLHLQYSHHFTIRIGLQLVRHLADVVSQIRWQLLCQSFGSLV